MQYGNDRAGTMVVQRPSDEYLISIVSGGYKLKRRLFKRERIILSTIRYPVRGFVSVSFSIFCIHFSSIYLIITNL